jgi:hypothetical protein
MRAISSLVSFLDGLGIVVSFFCYSFLERMILTHRLIVIVIS